MYSTACASSSLRERQGRARSNVPRSRTIMVHGLTTLYQERFFATKISKIYNRIYVISCVALIVLYVDQDVNFMWQSFSGLKN